ncbi:hypothetical protein PORCAN_501 [Porphyromonas crevioricanis JCM 13913]|nr:hypothetical protein PORCAN_501 [Porphyromonas crevioricanis JCM 13913]
MQCLSVLDSRIILFSWQFTDGLREEYYIRHKSEGSWTLFTEVPFCSLALLPFF